MTTPGPASRRPQRRGPRLSLTSLATTSLLLLGIILGLSIGLYYAWVASPVIYTDASPSRLREDLRADYLFLVSQSYAETGDLAQARQRLQAVSEGEMGPMVAAELELYLRSGRPAAEVRNMAELAQALGIEGEAVAIFAPTSALPQPTATPVNAPPTATSTLLPTPTQTRPPTLTPTTTTTPFPTAAPTATPQPVYRLLSQERVCDADGPAARIEVITLDALLDPLPGVEVVVSWESGSDRFFTGFKPTGGPSYGDFAMIPDISYAVTLAEGSSPVSGLRSELCPAELGGHAGGWRLTFQNLIVGIPTPERDDG